MVIDITQQGIAKFSQQMAELPKVVKTLLKSGLGHGDTAKSHNIPVQLVWHKEIVTPGGKSR